MLLGARTAAFGGGCFVNPYQTSDNALVSMWDAEWNDGFNSHSNTTQTWKDLVGTNDLYFQGNQVEWESKSFVSKRVANCHFSRPYYDVSQDLLSLRSSYLYTYQVIYEILSYQYTPEIFCNGDWIGTQGENSLWHVSNLIQDRSAVFMSHDSLYPTSRVYTSIFNNGFISSYSRPMLYSNKVFVSGTMYDYWWSNGNDLKIGCSAGWLNAKIKCVRAYNRILTGSEVSTFVDKDIERGLVY